MAKKSKQERLDALRDRLAKQDVGGGGDFMVLQEGRNQVRILPEIGGMDDGAFYQPVGRHYFPDGRRVYCPKFTSDGELECPVCEFVTDLYRLGDKASKKMAGQLRVSKRFWMNIIDRSDESRGPRVLDAGVTIFSAIVSVIGDPEYGDITDVDDGTDIRINRKGQGMKTEYDTMPSRHDSPLSDDNDLVDQWLDEAKDLAYIELSDDPDEDRELSEGHFVHVMPYNRIAEEYDLDAIIDYDEDDDEEGPAPKATKKRREPEDDDDEGEVKKEVRRRSARRRRK